MTERPRSDHPLLVGIDLVTVIEEALLPERNACDWCTADWEIAVDTDRGPLHACSIHVALLPPYTTKDG